MPLRPASTTTIATRTLSLRMLSLAMPLILVFLQACSDPDPRPSRIRLIDTLLRGEATVEAQSHPKIPTKASSILPPGRASELSKQRGARHEGTFIDRLLRAAGGGVDGDDESGVINASVAHVPAGVGALVQASLSRQRRAGDLFFALDLEAPPDPAVLRDPLRLQALIADRRPFLRTLLPTETEGRWEAAFEPGPPKDLLILTASFEGPDHAADIAEITVRPLDDAELWSLRAESLGDPHAQRVTIGSVTWEAIVLQPGEIYRTAVPVGLDGGSFHCAVSMDSRSPAALTLSVHVNGQEKASTSTTLRTPRDAGQTRPLDLRFPDSTQIRSLSLRVREAGPSSQSTREHPRAMFCRPVLLPSDDSRPNEQTQPDVVVLSLDTVRADRLGPYGSQQDTSPHINQLATTSAVFTHASSAAPWTLPSHASMLSGQYPDRHGAHGPASRIPKGTELLATTLRDQGYETAAFTGGGYVSPEFGFARGFERYATTDPAWPPRDLAGVSPQGSPIAQATSRSRARLMEWIEEESSAPRFLFVHTYAAHNYAASAADLRAVGATDQDIKALADTRLDPAAIAKHLRTGGDDPRAATLKKRAKLAYDATVRVADRLVGEVTAALERAGRLDRTLLIVTSDHGEELFERGTIGHGQSLHQEQIHVPLLIRGPGIDAKEHHQAVSLVDLVPTLLDLLDLPPTDADGRSLAPLLDGSSIEPRAVLARGNRRSLIHRSIRGARRKLIAVDQQDGSVQRSLFDLDEDPAETHNIYGSDAPRAARMERAMAGLVRNLRDRATAIGGLSSTTEGAGLPAELAQQLRELGYLGSEH